MLRVSIGGLPEAWMGERMGKNNDCPHATLQSFPICSERELQGTW